MGQAHRSRGTHRGTAQAASGLRRSPMLAVIVAAAVVVATVAAIVSSTAGSGSGGLSVSYDRDSQAL